jgi:ketol-acid reductoisomerase
MSEVEKFMNRVGRVNLGPEKLDEATAAKLNQTIDDIESGKAVEGLPPEWIKQEKSLKKLWDKKFLRKKGG